MISSPIDEHSSTQIRSQHEEIKIKDGDIGFKGGNMAQHGGETSENTMDYEMGGERNGEVKGS